MRFNEINHITRIVIKKSIICSEWKCQSKEWEQCLVNRSYLYLLGCQESRRLKIGKIKDGVREDYNTCRRHSRKGT